MNSIELIYLTIQFLKLRQLESVQPSGPVCDAELPGSIRIYVPSSGYSLALDNVELIHNPTLANSAFVQPQPPGIAPMFADCQD